MDKKVILVGTYGLSEKFEFMHELMRDLVQHNITVYPVNNIRFETMHTIVIFAWADRLYSRREEYQGIRADAFFSDHPAILDILRTYAEPYAVNNCHHNISVFDYICQVEREAKAKEYLRDVLPKTYITTAGIQDNEFHKRFMNSVYGAHPENRYFVDLNGSQPSKVELLWGRRNGKTQACIDYMTKLIERGELTMAQAENIYIRKDIDGAARLAAAMQEVRDRIKSRQKKLPDIKTVHFSGPVTAVIWEDKTKTIVRCKDGEVPDYEKGLAMAIAKKALGTNKSGSNYYDIFKKWLPKPEEEEQDG